VGADSFTFTVDDGQSPSVPATVSITVDAPPVISITPNFSTTWPDPLELDATISDDGAPSPAVLHVEWSQTGGSGLATFADATNGHTHVSFSAPGIYNLRLTVDDSLMTSHADVTVVVAQAPVPPPVSAPISSEPRNIVTPDRPAILRFHSDQIDNVDLNGYSRLGIRVYKQTRTLQPGDNDIVFDGRDDQGHPLASGTYLIIAKSSSFTQKIKVVVVR
jgi:hypothetical protein